MLRLRSLFEACKKISFCIKTQITVTALSW